MPRFHRVVKVLSLVGFGVVVGGCSVSTEAVKDAQKNVERVQSVLGAGALRLPSIPVDIDDSGRIRSVAGFDTKVVDDIAESLTGSPLIGRIAVLNKEYVAWFKRADIQHITLASRDEGLFVLVNGEALPYIAWDEDSIEAALDTLGQFQKDGHGAYLVTADAFQAIDAMLPVLQSLGVRLDIRLPRQDGVAAIPLPEDDAFDLALTDEEIDAVPLQTVDVEVEYRELPRDENGERRGWVPSLFGFSTIDLQTVGEPLDVKVPQLRLRDDIRRRFEDKAIGSMGLEARADGLFFTVDGRLMPHLAWSEATLTNLSELLDRLYPSGTDLPSDARWVPVVRSTAPMYNDFSVAVLLRFPEG